MLNHSKKISFFLLAVFVLTAIFFSGIIDKKETYFAQASFWDIIRAWVTINPLSVDISAPAQVEVDKLFKVETKLINNGEEKIENVKGEIFLPPALTLLKKDPIQEIGIIPPKKEKKIFWSVRGEKIGSYIISVLASGELKRQLVSAEDSTMVKVIKPLPRGKTVKWFQNLFDFFQERFGF
ncbi:MAG: hypothetical protein CO031_02005 [Candidatus Nealsonbacteria bacterium CG_4_9_14_0_2_um_filter_37_38]|nr:MAG: hypothetical protein COV63_03370 [Candidatus Nealsonbacteria bacterium CG11_big_fil_rev_8_21_14_0_20_37_68]PJC51585.1 MAG: hypothetical protein CO031_02005 [Candidatus Nealsonbacteria bacterium CG_4_9_14_0_2_um_filter_37_38]